MQVIEIMITFTDSTIKTIVAAEQVHKTPRDSKGNTHHLVWIYPEIFFGEGGVRIYLGKAIDRTLYYPSHVIQDIVVQHKPIERVVPQ